MTAKEAREKAEEVLKKSDLMNYIFNDIDRAVEKGEFEISFKRELNDLERGYIEKLGYTVDYEKYIEKTVISW